MAKNLFIIYVIILLATSCSSVKPASSPNTSRQHAGKESSVTFIDNISLNPGAAQDQVINASSTNKRDYKNDNKDNAGNPTIEKYSQLQFKYAILTNTPVEQLRDEKLLSFMDDWYGTRYRYGGTTKDGIDCSAFACLLMSSVYGINGLPRVARDQYDGCRRISRDELQQGDLVFFHTIAKKKTVSHVGIYLCNNKFVHASVSGVMISDMDEEYYAQHYVGAGRVK
jgi:cell wall-associated NlpC family hydrolase